MQHRNSEIEADRGAGTLPVDASETERHRTLENRLHSIDPLALETALNDVGYVILDGLLESQDCRMLRGLYPQEAPFRSHINMARHGFGRGAYKYFCYPLPPLVQLLRRNMYPKLVPIANRWHDRMGLETVFPDDHDAYIRQCQVAGQNRPTPLLLQYGEGDYNCLHQDVYGDLLFPLQVAVLLSAPEVDFAGGEFVLTEQRPRMQSRVEVVPLKQGDGVIFPVRHRPQQGKKRDYRVTMRHGVSRLHSGTRHTLGVTFHDAT